MDWKKKSANDATNKGLISKIQTSQTIAKNNNNKKNVWMT